MNARHCRLALLILGVCARAALAASYTTNFPLTENPISEGGHWINGGSAGLSWTNVKTASGYAQSTQDGTGSGYNDATAILTGTWGPAQTVQITAKGPSTRGGVQEVEMRLRSTMTASSSTGYEVDWTGGGLSFVRWNGPLGKFTSLYPQASVTWADGDVLKATIAGTVLTAYKNGVVVLTHDTAGDAAPTDGSGGAARYSTGNPGFGIDWLSTGGSNDFGISSFTATDSPSPTAGNSYTTNFPYTENPISEGAHWLNGGAVGLDWANVSTTPGYARGQQPPDTGNYNDSTAILAGNWEPDQTAQAVVRNVTSNTSAFMEVEIRLRSSMTAHNCGGYEVYWSANPANPYLTVARWNGPLNSWENIAGASQGVSIKTGDVLKASITGTVITAWINGVQKLQYETAGDSLKFSTGNPGIGFYLSNTGGNPAEQANYGFTSFTAWDNSAVPVVNSALTVSGTVNSAFSYTIAASNSPTSFSATGLPAGLSLNTSTGVISGTPTAAGTAKVTLSVTNGSGTGLAPLSLTINASSAPTITTQPANRTVSAGQTATFSVVASGSTPLSYQWQKNGVSISGATSASYTTPATTTTDNGATFRVVVSNALGSATSNAATLTVTPPDGQAPSVPINLVATAVSSTQINLSWTASTDNVSVAGYKIFRGGVQVGTSAGNSFSNTGLSANTTYTYTVSAFDAAGNNSAQSSPANATTPAGQAWAFVQGNANNSAAASNATAFSAATRAGDLIVVEVDWINSANFTSIGDSQGNVFTQIGTEQNAAGVGVKSRLYYARNIKGGTDTVTTVISGSVAYHELYIHEYSGLDPVNPLDSFSVNLSSGGTFTSNNATTTAVNDLLFGIEIDSGLGTAAAGWTVRSALDSNVAADQNAPTPGSYAFAGNSAGAFIAWIAAFKQSGGNVAPTITAQPASLTVTAGQSASLAVVATGMAPLAYQWKKNGTAISGATSATYSIAAAQATDAGAYSVTVSNAAGSVTSNNATLTVNVPNLPPSITSSATATPNPALAGQAVTLSASASDPEGAALTYTWDFGDGTPTVQGSSANHVYVVGSFTATVSVSDGVNMPVASSVVVVVNSPGTNTVTVTKGGSPLSGVYAYAYDSAGTYLGKYALTNAQGKAAFSTMTSGLSVKYRVTNEGTYFWSPAVTTPQDATISIPASTIVTVRKAGLPLASVYIYAFDAAGNSLNYYRLSDANGQASFAIASGSQVKFRVTDQGTYFWSSVTTAPASTTISVPANTTVTVQKAGSPLAGVYVYAFDSAGTYLNYARLTDANGTAVFALATGTQVKFRVSNQAAYFWSGVVTAPSIATISVPADTTVTVLQGTAPLAGVYVYAHNSVGTSLSYARQTNTSGQAIFALAPGQQVKFRTVINSQTYWSALITTPGTVTIALPVAAAAAPALAPELNNVSAAPSEPDGPISLGTVHINRRFKMKLSAPTSDKATQLRWKTGNRNELPKGVAIRNGMIGGRPKVVGSFIFTLVISSKRTSTQKIYELTIAP